MEMDKVLLIDDSDIDNMVNRKVIEKTGLASVIVVKKSAESAFEYLQQVAVNEPDNVPNLIFLDIRMPGIDGFGFLELFNQLPEAVHKKTRIVMLSSSIDAEDYNRAMANTYVKDFLNKPLKVEAVEKVAAQA